MRKFTVPAVAVLMLATWAAPAAAQGIARGVVLSATGAPVSGATVIAVQPEVSARTFTAVTDEDGEWVMLGMTVGPWEFSAEAEGFGGRALDIEVRANTPPVTFVLEPQSFRPEGISPNSFAIKRLRALDIVNELCEGAYSAVAQWQSIRLLTEGL
jgi:hypothetical protein